MALSYQLRNRLPQPEPSKKQTVLVTGAAGRIGTHFCEQTHERYDLRLLDHHGKTDKLQALGQTLDCELRDSEALRGHLTGVDTVLHLAADPNPTADWRHLLPANVLGTYQLMTAALAAGCRKVIYASSIHAVSGYPTDVQVKTSDPVNPGDLYGVSKCFGEALGRFLAEQEQMAVIALRIGAFQPSETATRSDRAGIWSAWISPRDLTQLITRCVDDASLQFAIFHAVSGHRFTRLDISDARELLGYAPEDDFTTDRPEFDRLDFEPHGETNPLPKTNPSNA